MPTYVLPQVLVFQDFQIQPSVVANPLCAHIAGGHAYLCRYSNTDEQKFGLLGYYDPFGDEPFNWPHRPAGGLVDASYVKLWLKDALLQYFDSAAQGVPLTRKAGANNQVCSSGHNAVNFRDNGIYLRDQATFLDRDVALGDTLKLRYVDKDGNPQVMWTYVRDFVGDIVASQIGVNGVELDGKNAITVAKTHEVTFTTPTKTNCVKIDNTTGVDDTQYNGLATGAAQNTYRIRVIEGSMNGDLRLARLRVTSDDGEDDVAAVSPNVFGTPTAIGTRGLTVTFSLDKTKSQTAETEGYEPSQVEDLITGQEWDVFVQQSFTTPYATCAGTYTDENSTTYIVQVVKGGAWADGPQVRVTTTNGIDMSGPTTVAEGTAFPVGQNGVTMTLSDPQSGTATGLCLGDRYYVEVVGQSHGPMRTIVLGHNIPTDVDPGASVDVTLFIRKPLLQVPHNRDGFAPLTNWDTTETQITVREGVIAYDESWTSEGVPEPLPVISEINMGYGEMFVEYRAWLPTLSYDVGAISDVGTIDTDVPGALSPDNPLKWGVFKALGNSNGTEVKFTSVPDPTDPEKWADVLGLLLGRDDVYGLVPLTRDKTVLDLYQAHVDNMSSPEMGLWRVAWFNLLGKPEIPIVSTGSTVENYIDPTTTDKLPCYAVFEGASGTPTTGPYIYLRCTSGNSAFVLNGVHPGDIVRGLYVNDGFGNWTYSSFVVDEVESEDQIRLMAGPAAYQSVPSKIEIWRNLTLTDEAQAIALDSGAWANRRIRSVWPDTIDDGTTIMEGYHLCAALAGEASGILPHQGMTQLEISGFDSVPRSKRFNRPQLDSLAVAGTWIVVQDNQTGRIYTRQAVTTGLYTDINQREEMMCRNVDSISYRFKDQFAPYIGVTNVTPSMIAKLKMEVNKLITVLQTERFTVDLGGQLINATIAQLAQHPTLLDRIVCVLNCSVPYALNNLEIHLVI